MVLSFVYVSLVGHRLACQTWSCGLLSPGFMDYVTSTAILL